MMKLILSLTLIWTLSSTAGALQCLTCLNTTCSSTAPVTCATETMCITAAIQTVSLGTPGTQIFKACASSSLCPTTGTQTFSVNLGVSSALASAQCCNTDNCNSATLPFPSTQSVNSLQCLVCNPLTSQCTTSVQCKGNEDRCFQATVMSGSNTIPAFGCASANLCAAASTLGSLPFLQSAGNVSSGPSCCNTSLCNTGLTTAAPTTTTVAPTTTAAPTTTTVAPTTTTVAPTTTTVAPTTTTVASTTTTVASTTTTVAPTVATVQTTTTTASDACCIRLGMIHLLLGLLIFTLS